MSQMLCRFKTTPLEDGTFRHDCQRTTCTLSFINGSPVAPMCNCKGMPETKRVFNFTVAMIQHAMNGLPSCTQAEIDERWTICKGCELYKKVNDDLGFCTHKSCGCSLSNITGYVSKIGWRDQHCPIGKWPVLFQLGG